MAAIKRKISSPVVMEIFTYVYIYIYIYIYIYMCVCVCVCVCTCFYATAYFALGGKIWQIMNVYLEIL